MSLSALLPALAFFGSVAVATSGPSSGSGTSKIVKKAAQGFVDKPTTALGKFEQGAGDYTRQALFGESGILNQISNTPVDVS